MNKLSIEDLNEAAHPGGSSALVEKGELMPAAGEGSLISPAKYLRGSTATYVYEIRYIDGEPKQTVLIDSRSSVANRLEDALQLAIDEGHPILSKMPRIIVSYDTSDGTLKESDLQLPHRFADAHVRLGFVDGKGINECEAYRAARNATERDAWSLFDLSPISVLLGSWDSTRKAHQVRFASAVTGEIIGVLADQNADPDDLVTRRSGARVDPVAAKIVFTSASATKIIAQIGDELSANKKKDLEKKDKGEVKGSEFVIGAIPPSVDAIDGIATSSIIRSYVLSFATLRRLHFGKGIDGDAAIRTLLAAVAVNAIVRNDSELYLRANTHLVEKAQPQVRLDRRMGNFDELEPMSIEEADILLEDAYNRAHQVAGIDWHGQTLEVKGNPEVIKGASDDSEE